FIIQEREKLEITVTLPDGKNITGYSWKTTPQDIAISISKSLTAKCLVAEVNGELWDLCRPLEGSCKIKLLTWEDEKAKQVFFHSSAHVLGEALERCTGGCLCHGPPLEEGFFYDIDINGRTIHMSDLSTLEDVSLRITAEDQKFERLELEIDVLREMFKYNKYKQHFLNKIETPTTTVYRCGPLIDLCRGPHLRSTKEIKAFLVNKTSAVFFGGDRMAESLQRVYGVAFPDTKLLKEWKARQEMAARADHHRIGKDQELFFFHPWSPGAAFFLPYGAHIFNKLINHMKSQYRLRGFKEVITPNVFNTELWVQSGHMKHYADDMFLLEKDQSLKGCAANSDSANSPQFALKPMNCPGHFLMFLHRPRSHRELPLRYADFGVLHRNEKSGALQGLTRVRRFQQDDAHIFCSEEKLEEEIDGAIDFLHDTYAKFGFKFSMALSTRPEKFLGEVSLWDLAEAQLMKSLEKYGSFTIKEGDGAFYGPKIDVQIRDALNRPFQCGTIQLDFQGPLNFDLKYSTNVEGEMKRPVVIHRAIFGSLERMFAILCENFVGKWPMWLSPRQVIVIPVGRGYNAYAQQVHQQLFASGLEAEVDVSGDLLSKKVGRSSFYNFILVVGQKEMDTNTVNVRAGKVNIGVKSVSDFISNAKQLIDTFSLENQWVFNNPQEAL
ncbi:hypothetical protein Zmor_011900, partial [Zophobas morio]